MVSVYIFILNIIKTKQVMILNIRLMPQRV